MEKNRNRLYLHLGVTLFALFPGLLIALIADSLLYPLAFIVFMNLLCLTGAHWLLVIAYHVLKPFSRISGEEAFLPERMVIGLSGVKSRGIPPDRILLLLPHCLQNHSCEHRITFNPGNCKRCGGCPVGELVDLAEKTGIKIAVATGGTLARRHVTAERPQAVIAVACPRDLGQGMLDAWPVPVYGIENSRPHGDCLDTMVDTEAVRKAIEDLTS